VDKWREDWRQLNRRMPDIHQDEYTVEGLSHLLGIPRDVITHEITTGELHANRVGGHTICISRDAVLDWLQRRGVGI
jgi:excisionase family DNA binding protein